MAEDSFTIITPKFGRPSGYTSFEEDGTMKLEGNATVYKDLLPSSVTLNSTGANYPAFTAYNGTLRAHEFVGAGATLKEMFLGFQMPHEWKEGSTISPHLHIRIPSDGTGGVIKFYVDYSWTNVGEVEGAVTTVSATATIAANDTTKSNTIFSLGGIVGTGKIISSIFMCRIYRDPADVADTFGSSVWLKSADIHVECDTIGSREILTK